MTKLDVASLKKQFSQVSLSPDLRFLYVNLDCSN